VGKNLPPHQPPILDGSLKILKKTEGQIGLLDPPGQGDIGMAEKKLKGYHILDLGFTLEIAGVGLDGQK
jgi:hypothetical protein